MSNLVFVVIATKGDYSDRTEWPVMVVASKERAEELVKQYDRERDEWIATVEVEKDYETIVMPFPWARGMEIMFHDKDERIYPYGDRVTFYYSEALSEV